MKIVSTFGLTSEQRQIVERAAGDWQLTDRRCRSDAEMADVVKDGCDILLSIYVPDQLIRNAPNLKWVQIRSAGADHALVGLLAERTDIAITSASGVHATAIGEYTICSMLAFAHGFHLMIRAQARHEWMRLRLFMDGIEPLRDKTLGVIGYGSIGRETARMAQALGMRVLALKRNPKEKRDLGWCPEGLGDPEGKIPARFYGPGECTAILGESDYVLVTLPLTPHTYHFVGAKEIAAMRPGGFIVNIGRGEVIDENALADALRHQRIGGAGLDVFEEEPLSKESPFWELENVILTPHMSGAHKGYNTDVCRIFAENLRRFRAGEPLLNVVDRSLGY